MEDANEDLESPVKFRTRKSSDLSGEHRRSINKIGI